MSLFFLTLNSCLKNRSETYYKLENFNLFLDIFCHLHAVQLLCNFLLCWY